MKVLVVIPARYGSTRFPGKALADLEGRPLVVRVMEQASRMETADQVVAATDDPRIFDAVIDAGFACEMTADHPTGTDRIGEVAARLPGDILLNLQGDEPLLDPVVADALVRLLQADPTVDIGTCAHPFADTESWRNPNQVKVLVDRMGFALYFSRAAVPGAFPGGPEPGPGASRRHVGIYAYRRAALERFLALERTPLEQAEGLEQLRALENGLRIKVLEIDQAPVGVDTPADLETVRRIFRSRHK